jgi:glutathione S-transferase
MILISATPSPFARKVRIALIEKGVPFEVRDEIPWHGDTETPQYNPLEQLPILIPDEGEPVYESTYILEWIEHVYPDPPLLPADGARVLEAKRIAVLAEGVMDAIVHLFFEFQRPAPSDPWIARQLRKLRGGMRELDRRLGDRRYFVADQFGLADLSTISVLGMQDVASSNGMVDAWQQKDPLIRPWRELYPNLKRYEAFLCNRPSVRDTAPIMFQLAEPIV